MGDPKKKHKKYRTPERPYDQSRIMEELRLLGTYGLRNKKELWRHRTMLRNFQRISRATLSMESEKRTREERFFLSKMHTLGLVQTNASLDDVLGMRIEDILERRLQTLVYRNRMASSLFQARQLIVHGHIAVEDRIVSSPSYIVKREEENKISYAPSSPLATGSHPLRQEMVALQRGKEEERG